MRIAYFTHSLKSCWNHGNAHFLRGVLDELIERGHEVSVFEPRDAWSLQNLLADHGPSGLDCFHRQYPRLSSISYDSPADAEDLLDGADLVIVHEWNAPDLVARLGRLRRAGGRFTLLFHDTHHRAVSAPEEMRAYELDGYDGVLAFGEALAEIYRQWGWGERVWTWHEAADLKRFHPPARQADRHGLVWIGNWGDGERSSELQHFLLEPAQASAMPLDIFGVRYPPEAKAMLARHGARYRGWTPNADVPQLFARYLATVHVPRQFYTSLLPGIPTIRVFEALACGIPLVTAPWTDSEGLFRPGTDYLVAEDGAAMQKHLMALRDDPALRESLVRNGLETIRNRHSCAHRVDELLAIAEQLAFADSKETVA